MAVILKYRMQGKCSDTTEFDVSGNGNHGNYVGNPGDSDLSVVGSKSLDCYTNAGGINTGLNIVNTYPEFSVMFRVYMSGVSPVGGFGSIICGHLAPIPTNSFSVIYSNISPNPGLSLRYGGYAASIGYGSPTPQWLNVLVTVGSHGCRMLCELGVIEQPPLTLAPSISPFTIGTNPGGNAFSLSIIQDFTLYDEVISDEEYYKWKNDRMTMDTNNELSVYEISEVGITDGLIGYFPMIENGVGYGEDTTITPTVITGSPTPTQNNGIDALNFSGSDSLRYGDNPFNVGTGDMTAIVIFRAENFSSGYRAVCGKHDSNSGNHRWSIIAYGSGTGPYQVRGIFDAGPGSSFTVDRQNGWTPGEWCFAALVIDRDSNASLYVDDLTPINTNISASASYDAVGGAPFKIGAYSSSGSPWNDESRMIGDIGEVKIFNRVLTQEEITVERRRMMNKVTQLSHKGKLFSKIEDFDVMGSNVNMAAGKTIARNLKEI